jgi:hypothetical protein
VDTKKDTSDSSGPERQKQDTGKWLPTLVRNVQGTDSDVGQVEDAKADTLDKVARAMKENDLETAETLLKQAAEMDSVATQQRLREMKSMDNLEVSPPPAAADTTTQIEEPDPNTRKLARPTNFEAKEGSRNVEDDLVERNPEICPPGHEGKLSRL